MSFLVHTNDLRADSSVERLIVEVWLNALQSRVASPLSPPPFSILSLLDTIRTLVASGDVRASTSAKPIRAVLASSTSDRWLPATHPKWHAVAKALQRAAAANPVAPFTDVTDSIDALHAALGAGRVAKHIEFVTQLSSTELCLVEKETLDLLADLIALGHSESYLFGWGRAVFLDREAEAPLRDRIALVGDLGRREEYVVAIKVSPNVWIAPTREIHAGRNLGRLFPAPPFEYQEGETAASVKVRAPDHKAAVAEAVYRLMVHVRTLKLTNRLDDFRIVGDKFVIQNLATKELLNADSAIHRQYTPPKLKLASIRTYLSDDAVVLHECLDRCLFWLAESRTLHYEAEFLTLWLSLCALFDSDQGAHIVPPLARYAALRECQALAEWIANYIGIAWGYRHRLGEVPGARGIWGATQAERLKGVVELVQNEPVALSAFAFHSPLLGLRMQRLRSFIEPRLRPVMLLQHESQLQVLLPWIQSVRHTVAHLGKAGVASLELANRHVAEYISTAYDQVSSAAWRQSYRTVGEAHLTVVDNFDTIVDNTLRESCVDPSHANLGSCHFGRPHPAHLPA